MLGTRQIWVMFLISFVDVAVTAVIFEIPNFLYDWALDKYFQPPPLQKVVKKKKVNQEQNLASSIACLLWRHKVLREHFRVFCFSPLIILGEMEQKALISYPQIFLKFFLYFMIDVMKKKIVFLNKPFIAYFILQVLKNSDFSYLSLHDFFRLFRPIIIERGNLCKFSLSHWVIVTLPLFVSAKENKGDILIRLYS